MVFWNLWEALGLGVISGPMHAKVNPPFQDGKPLTSKVHLGIVLVILIPSIVSEDVFNIVQTQSQMYFI